MSQGVYDDDGKPMDELAEADRIWLKPPMEQSEPIMARILRLREADRRVVSVHLVDGSQLTGQIEDVTEDGTMAEVVNGRDSYVFDVTALVVIQTRRQTETKEALT